MNSNYSADEIEVLEGLEAVRKPPGMYIGSTGKKGLLFLIEELVNYSIEEAIAGYCNNIEIILNEDGSFSVTNNGHGISTDINPQTGKSDLEMQLTYLSAFRKDLEQLNKGSYVADIGFTVRENATGGGAVLNKKMISMLHRVGMEIYFSEYDPR